MQSLASGANALDQLALDERMDVFVGARYEGRISRGGLDQFGQRTIEGLLLVCRQHARTQQRLGPRPAAFDIVFEQAAIERKRRAEGEDIVIGGTRETAGPESG